jgi:hypothetical protein
MHGSVTPVSDSGFRPSSDILRRLTSLEKDLATGPRLKPRRFGFHPFGTDQ